MGGGVDHFSRKITNFRDCLENMGLRDLGYTGSWFTKAVDRRDNGCIKERIVRALVTTEWRRKFPKARLFHLANLVSNHCLIVAIRPAHTKN